MIAAGNGCMIHETMFSGTRSKSSISVTGEVIITQPSDRLQITISRFRHFQYVA